MKEAWALLKAAVDNINLDFEEENRKFREEQQRQAEEERRRFSQRYEYRGSSKLYCKQCNQEDRYCQCDTPIPHNDAGPEPAE